MKEMENALDNIIIFNGEKEYLKKDILSDKELFKCFNNYYNFHLPKDLIKDMVKENGIIYLVTDEKFKIFSLTLKNISPQLNDQFLKKYNFY
nr:hypothetical protein [uncultured Flavobacterium sp.]